jgi:uncharacterized protein (DUF433 family)
MRGRRLAVAQVVRFMHANQLSVAETAWNFSLSEAEVAAALLYYEEHKQAIEAQEAEEERLFQAIKHQNDSR